MSRIYILMLGCFVLLAGCAKTTVVLLPDEEGKVGQVVVQAAGQETALSTAEQRVDATSGGLSKVSTMSNQAVERTFGTTLKALPEKPESDLIYFATESTKPTPESMKLLPGIVEKYKARTAPSLEIFGHTDHLGDKDFNLNLSLARAQEVRNLLISRGLPADNIKVRGFGYRDPLFPAQPGKAEPRNRRVEIFMR